MDLPVVSIVSIVVLIICLAFESVPLRGTIWVEARTYPQLAVGFMV